MTMGRRDEDLRHRGGLRAAIRERLTDGTLPQAAPLRVLPAHGAGELCAACDDFIAGGGMEMIVEWAAHRRRCLHRICYEIWVDEVRTSSRRERAGVPLPDGVSLESP
ncbi:MAG: hypothetical protein HY294_13920 [Candidatus Rokubacteria bacterium]|nr:hypothetical protein [Candidatus Rokubacteria bacterium]